MDLKAPSVDIWEFWEVLGRIRETTTKLKKCNTFLNNNYEFIRKITKFMLLARIKSTWLAWKN